jgi:hypothetical protein
MPPTLTGRPPWCRTFCDLGGLVQVSTTTSRKLLSGFHLTSFVTIKNIQNLKCDSAGVILMTFKHSSITSKQEREDAGHGLLDWLSY